MSRFVTAQSLAFQKLLKKYKKWTGSSELGKRFHEAVLDRPASFSKKDFYPLLAQWTEVLASVRAPFENGMTEVPNPPGTKNWIRRSNSPKFKVSLDPETSETAVRNPNNAADLQSIWNSCSSVDIDITFATSPLGCGATRAVYWVHPDNLVQIHVLLLQYTRSQRPNDSDTPPETPSSLRSSPRGSLSTNGIRPISRTDEEVGIIVCDDLRDFAERRNCETISDFEDRPGTIAEKATASIRYSSNGEAAVILGGSSSKSDERPLPIKAKFECKEIHRLFDASKPHQCNPGNDLRDFDRACTWLADHQEVQPLVQLQSRRSRFIGLKNNQTSGIWVMLDKDIMMRSVSKEILSDDKALLPMSERGKAFAKSFPHTILEVRVEGNAGSGFITALDESHLVSERFVIISRVVADVPC